MEAATAKERWSDLFDSRERTQFLSRDNYFNVLHFGCASAGGVGEVRARHRA
jgi:hypothetical protein